MECSGIPYIEGHPGDRFVLGYLGPLDELQCVFFIIEFEGKDRTCLPKLNFRHSANVGHLRLTWRGPSPHHEMVNHPGCACLRISRVYATGRQYEGEKGSHASLKAHVIEARG